MKGQPYGNPQQNNKYDYGYTDKTHGILPYQPDSPPGNEDHTAVIRFLVGDKPGHTVDIFLKNTAAAVHFIIYFRCCIFHVFSKTYGGLVADNVSLLCEQRIFNLIIQILIQHIPDILHIGNEYDMPYLLIGRKTFNPPDQINAVIGVFIFKPS